MERTKEKSVYVVPQTEAVSLQLEGIVCLSGTGGEGFEWE